MHRIDVEIIYCGMHTMWNVNWHFWKDWKDWKFSDEGLEILKSGFLKMRFRIVVLKILFLRFMLLTSGLA